MGKFTVDLKYMKFLKFKISHYKLVMQGSNHLITLFKDYERLSSTFLIESNHCCTCLIRKKKFGLLPLGKKIDKFPSMNLGDISFIFGPIWEEICSRSIEGNLQILLPEPNVIRFRIQIVHDVTNLKIFACPQNERLYSKFHEPVIIIIDIWLDFHLYVMVILVVPKRKADSCNLSYFYSKGSLLDEKHLP
jgi:hypothetical protein